MLERLWTDRQIPRADESDGLGVYERCGCGASIRASRRDVIAWRTSHWHQGQAAPEPDREGASSQAELAERRTHEHGENSKVHDFSIVYARMGFNPNPPSS